jgi:hypothetical protein
MPVQTFDDGSTLQTFDDGSTLATATDGSLSSSPSITDAGPASGLSGITDTIGGALGAVGSFLFGGAKPKLPQPNPLFDYASYNYILGISVLTDDQLNSPDTTYMRGMKLPLICKSGSVDPSNRISTPFGTQEFYIDNLEINSIIGMEKGSNTNVLNLKFDIIEPYSMGMFFVACQAAAWKAKQDNWRTAPFLLTIEFKGNKETGSMVSIPGTKRYIPFKFLTSDLKVTERGTIYSCTAYPTNGSALDNANKQLKTDISIAGSTVQEILQTGPKSLQAVINKRLKALVDTGTVAEQDKVVILFPKKIWSAGSGASGGTSNAAGAASSTTAAAPTTNPTTTQAPSAVEKQLGVTVSKANDTLVQAAADVNDLGRSSLGFGTTRVGDMPLPRVPDVYDPETKRVLKGSNIIDPKTGEFKFSQNTDIINAINQVMLFSDFAAKTISGEPDNRGMRKWWRIDTQVYRVSSTANIIKTGEKPSIIVYRVVPYDTHSSRLKAPNVKVKGFDSLKKEVAKVYNYIYTGKNVDILNFDIKFEMALSDPSSATAFKDSGDNVQRVNQSGTSDPKSVDIKRMNDGKPVEKTSGANTSGVVFAADKSKNDLHGGHRNENEATRAARMFHDITTQQNQMMELSMRILGDPYYIAQSGQGNYTSQPASANLNKDGTINYQNGEVDIIINFRTPTDVNQTTGLYDFGKSSKSSPVLMFSGLYMLREVNSKFSGGKFEQELIGVRRDLQELKATGSAYNNTNPETNKNADPADSSAVGPIATKVFSDPSTTTVQDANGKTYYENNGITYAADGTSITP